MAGPVQTVGAIFVLDGSILLGLRASHRRSSPDCWDVIGGHVELGETIFEALTREVREEIGVDVLDARRLTSIRFDEDDGRAASLHLFVVDRWEGVPQIADQEHVLLRWFPPVELARLLNLAIDAYRPIFAAVGATRGDGA